MLRRIIAILIFFLSTLLSQAQYISRSEAVPYVCPVICASGTLTLKVPQIQALPPNSQVQALLSDASGSFASPQILPVDEYSSNLGTTWLPGPYVFVGNVNDLYIRVTIPAGTTPGSNYTIKMRSSTGYVSNDLFQCGGNNTITVTPVVVPLPAVPEANQGIGNWIGHIYTWTPTTGAVLNTPALIASQNFFSPANYQGHLVYNNLPFNINFATSGGVPGTWNNGTSISCGDSWSNNFSLRMRRQENFSPGYYQFTIQGDDGIRFSVDGGVTWILDSFIEQQYSTSFKTTATSYPNGICLAGPTDLVVEYFQRPLDAQMTFTVTQISTLGINDPADLSLCAGNNGTMSVGAAVGGTTYQWQVSTDGGTTFNTISNNAVYSNVSSSILNLTAIPNSYDGYLYRCLITGPCGQNTPTEPALLTVEAVPAINQQPTDQTWCNGQVIGFSVISSGSGLTYQWQLSNDGGVTFTNVPAAAPYSGSNSSALTLIGSSASVVGTIYQVVVSGCGSPVTSNQVEILAGGSIVITQQPLALTVCQGQAASFSVQATGGTSYQWQVNSGSGFNNVNNTNGYSGAQTATLDLIGAATSVNGLAYQCVITGGCSGNVTSASVVLTVNPNTSITQQPQNQTICEGENAQISLNANGSGLTLQWTVSSDGGVTYSALTNAPPYSGVTTTSLGINAPANSLSGNLYQCNVNGVCGTNQSSNAVSLTITASPTVVTNPSPQTACEGEAVEFQAEISGSPQYQWQISYDNGGSYSPLSNGNGITGATSGNLTIDPVQFSMNQAVFVLSASACNTSISSAPAILEVLPLPEVSLIQVPPPVCPGEDLTISVSTVNATSIQWQMNTNGTWMNVQPSGNFNGVNQSTLQINNVPSNLQNALFRCEVSSSCGTPVYSAEALLFLNGIPVLLAGPTTQVICSGGAVTFTTVAQGEGIFYQWQLLNESGNFVDLDEGGNYSGTQSPALLAEAVTELNNTIYRCLVSGCGDELETDTARLVIFQNDPVYIPSAFTPDTDKINPSFKIFTEGAPELDASIYNRWGELVYHWTDVQEGWNGTYLGFEVEEGVYVYRIKVTTQCEQNTHMGTITLLR